MEAPGRKIKLFFQCRVEGFSSRFKSPCRKYPDFPRCRLPLLLGGAMMRSAGRAAMMRYISLRASFLGFRGTKPSPYGCVLSTSSRTFASSRHVNPASSLR